MHIKLQDISFHLRLFSACMVEKKGSKIESEKKIHDVLYSFLKRDILKTIEKRELTLDRLSKVLIQIRVSVPNLCV